MQSLELSSPEGSAQSLGHVPTVPTTVTAGWLVKRAALWILFVGVGIAAACVLYVAASKAESESAARSSPGRDKGPDRTAVKLARANKS